MTPTYDTPIVDATGSYTVGQYTIELVDELPDRRVGQTSIHNDLLIKAGQSVFDTYRTCVHEKLHNMAPTSPHEWMYDTADITVDKTCLSLLYKLEEGY